MNNSGVLTTLARPIEVLSPNKISRIPRWCQNSQKNKLPPSHTSPSAKKAYQCKFQNTFANEELTGVCEPPSLRTNELKKVWKAKTQRKEVDDKLRETTAHAEFLKGRLKEVKVTIETISARLENSNCPYNDNEGEYCDGRDVLVDMAKENMRLQRELLENLDLEEKITEDLQNTHRQLWEAGVAEQFFTLEVEDKVVPAIHLHNTRKAFMAQKRILREKTMKKTAEMFRVKTMSTVVDSLKNSVNAPTKKSLTVAKVRGIKNARKKMEHFIKKTMMARKQQKLSDACDKQMKQDYQHKILTHLKTEIDEQRDNLKIKNDAKRRRDARIAQEKERIKQELAKSGKNPYFIEHLLAIEEKRAQQQRKILEKEQERLGQLQRDYEVEEQVKKHEKIKKNKWDDFWSKRLKARKQAILKKNMEFYDTTVSNKDDNLSYEEPKPPPPSIVSTLKSEKQNLKHQKKPKPKTPQEPLAIASVTEVQVPPKRSIKTGFARSKSSIPRKRSSSSKGSKGSLNYRERSLKESPRVSWASNARFSGEEDGEDFHDFLSGTGTLDYESSIRSEEYEGESDFYELTHSSSLRNAKKSSEVSTRSSGLRNNKKSSAVSTHSTNLKNNKKSSAVSTHSTNLRNNKKSSAVSTHSTNLTNTKKSSEIIIHSTNLSNARKSSDVHISKVQTPPAEGSFNFTTGHVQTVDNEKKVLGGGDAFVLNLRKSKYNLYKKKKKKQLNRPTFKWDPKIVVFSDYEIGKIYKKTLTIRNISTERVKLVLKDFLDTSIRSVPPTSTSNTNYPTDPSSTQVPLTDLIRFKSTVSKPISPGLSHDIHLTFTPPALQNWKGVLKFESNVEPFEVLIECFKKRVVPSFTPEKVVFTNIVANTTALATIKLKNIGAKNGFIARIIQRQPISSANTQYLDSPSEKESPPGTKESQQDDIQSQSSSTLARVTLVSPQFPPFSDNSSQHSRGSEDLKSRSGRKKSRKNKTKIPQTQQVEGGTTAGNSNGKLVREVLDELVSSIIDNVFIAYVKDCKRDLKVGATRTICIVFRPLYVDSFKTTFEIEFDDNETDKVTFQAMGTPIENPVSLEPLNTDFRICTMDHNYQQTINVSTRIRGAGKVTPEVPKELRAFVEVAPKQCTVNPNSFGKFSVKLRPRPIMMEEGNPALPFIDKESNIIDFPVYFHLSFPYKTNTPLIATFMAVLNKHTLEISPTELDMGKCCATETVATNFSVTNNSCLPQNIGFVELPKCITIQPNFGFATLLPHETRDFDLLVSLPESAVGELNYYLKCQSLERREAFLRVECVAKKNLIQFSQSSIFFPATAVGSVSYASIDVYSNMHIRPDPSMSTPKFEFSIDPEIPIQIIPQASYIPFGQTQKIFIRFDAKLSDEDVKTHLLKMLEREYIELQATNQRELDGINQTLKYEMVFGEDDFDEEFLNKLVTINTKLPVLKLEQSEGPKSKKQSDSMKGENRSSFIQQALPESNIKLSINSEHSATKSTKRSSSKITKKSSKGNASNDSIKQTDSEHEKRKSDLSGHSSGGKKRSSKNLSLSSHPKLRSSKRMSPEEAEESEAAKRTSDRGLSFMLNNKMALEQRRKELVKQLQIPYEPPNVDGVEADSPAYQKAKRDLMKHLTAASRTYTIPCFVTDEIGGVDMIFLYLKCHMAQPSLLLLGDSNVINFGKIPVGVNGYREARLYNVSSGLLRIRVDMLDPYGPFLQCNASVRKIPSDHVFTLKLRFKPQDTKTFEESIKIKGGESLITLTLVGTGVVPEFTLKPTKNDLYVGTINVGNFGHQQFEITNSSEAELRFTVELLNQGHYEGTLAIPSESSHKIHHKSQDLKHTHLLPTTPADTAPPPSAAKSGTGSAFSQKMSEGEIKELEELVLPEDAEGEIVHERQNSIEIPRRKTSTSASKISTSNSGTHRHSRKESESLPDPVFEVKNKDNSIKTFTTKELIAHLDEKKEQYFFQAQPSSPIYVDSKGSAKFNVFFVPATSGRFFAEYQVRLYETIVHRFSIIGVGQNLGVNSGEHE